MGLAQSSAATPSSDQQHSVDPTVTTNDDVTKKQQQKKNDTFVIRGATEQDDVVVTKEQFLSYARRRRVRHQKFCARRLLDLVKRYDERDFVLAFDELPIPELTPEQLTMKMREIVQEIQQDSDYVVEKRHACRTRGRTEKRRRIRSMLNKLVGFEHACSTMMRIRRSAHTNRQLINVLLAIRRYGHALRYHPNMLKCIVWSRVADLCSPPLHVTRASSRVSRHEQQQHQQEKEQQEEFDDSVWPQKKDKREEDALCLFFDAPAIVIDNPSPSSSSHQTTVEDEQEHSMSVASRDDTAGVEQIGMLCRPEETSPAVTDQLGDSLAVSDRQ